jgi:hypothetical protein
MQQNLIAVEFHSASPVVVDRVGGTRTGSAFKKKKAKLELSSLVAKDLEELSRKRAIKQEPLGEPDSLQDIPPSSGPPVSKRPSTREGLTNSSPISLVDVSGVASIRVLDNTNPDSPSVMDVETHTSILDGGGPGAIPVRFVCNLFFLQLYSVCSTRINLGIAMKIQK